MAEKAQPPPPRVAGLCPQGRLSEVHIPSGWNGKKWPEKGRCCCVYVCVCECVCVHFICVSGVSLCLVCAQYACVCLPGCMFGTEASHTWTRLAATSPPN